VAGKRRKRVRRKYEGTPKTPDPDRKRIPHPSSVNFLNYRLFFYLARTKKEGMEESRRSYLGQRGLTISI